MKSFIRLLEVEAAAVFLSSGLWVSAEPVPNLAPTVAITYPHSCLNPCYFTGGMFIRLKAEAIDRDGSIAGVQFFAETNLLGVVTNPPYALEWIANIRFSPDPPFIDPVRVIRAVAIDNLGATSTSAPVRIYVTGGPPPYFVYEITSPRNGAVLTPPATFNFSAEFLAGPRGPFAAEFYVGTNRVGLVPNPPYSIIVSNLVEGDYTLNVKPYLISDECKCAPVNIRVANLASVFPLLGPDKEFQFDVITGFPLKETAIQASTNLLDWVSISTNLPSANIFHFIDPKATNYFQRFYRVLLSP